MCDISEMHMFFFLNNNPSTRVSIFYHESATETENWLNDPHTHTFRMLHSKPPTHQQFDTYNNNNNNIDIDHHHHHHYFGKKLFLKTSLHCTQHNIIINTKPRNKQTLSTHIKNWIKFEMGKKNGLFFLMTNNIRAQTTYIVRNTCCCFTCCSQYYYRFAICFWLLNSF